MSGTTISMSADKIGALKLQSSCYGAVIPLTYGVCQVAGNLLWFGGFKAVPHTTSQGGKGGGVTQQNTTFSYAADVLMGLAHGPITNVPRVWRGKSVFSGGVAGSQVQNVSETYTGGAANSTYTLSHGATLITFGQLNAAVTAADGTPSVATLSRGFDYTYSQGVVTLRNGNWNGKQLTVAYQYRGSAIATTALDGLGLTFIKGEIGQAAWSGLASYGSQSIGYSGLCAVAATQYDLGDQASVENHKFEVVGPWAYSISSSVMDVDPSVVMRDVLTMAGPGANFPAAMLDAWSSYSDYCVANNLLVSPCLDSQQSASDLVGQAMRLTNSAPVWSGGRLKVVPYGDAAVTANGRTFTPNTTPVYDLDDDAYTPQDGDDPVHFELKTPADRKNIVQVEYLDRSLQYATAIATAKDLTDISANGPNPMDVISAHWICDSSIARHVAELVKQRSLCVLATYTFGLPWHYALLEPMDLVTLTDSVLGLDKWPVRITKITEDDDGDLLIEAEDYPAGVCSAALYSQQGQLGFQHDYNASPGTAASPIIFEAPAAKTGTGVALRIAVRSSGNAAWGGAQVWISLDGTNYRQAGVVYGAARTGAVAAAATGSSTSFQVNGVTGQLLNGSAADAAALATLCYIGGASPEYFAYQTATLTGTGAYTLTGLVRQAYGTPAGAHAVSDVFVRVDDSVVQFEDLDVSMVGKTVYVKVCSFNQYQAAQQSLADVTATTYTITGNMAAFLPGVGGKGLGVNASGLTFRYPVGGGANPSSITLSAVKTGILSGTVNWSVIAGTATLSATTGDSVTLAAVNMATDAVTIRASVTDGVGTYVDDTTLVKVYDGANGAPGGTGPAGLNNAVVYVYQRASSAPSLPSATVTYTFATGAVAGLNNGWTAGVPAGSSPLYVTVATASNSGTTDTIAPSEWASAVVMSQDGAPGANGLNTATVYLFQRTSTSTAPSLPSAAVTYTFATGVATGVNNGWTQTMPTSGGSFRWVTTATALGTGATDSIANTEWAAASVLAQDGNSGANAPLLTLSCTAQTVTFDGQNALSPSSQTITATAVLQNLAGTAAFTCTLYDASGANLGNVTMGGGASNTRTLTGAQFTSLGAAAWAVITATLSGLSDTETIVKLRDGTGAVVGDLSNQDQTLTADSTGHVTSYAGASTAMTIYVGLVDDTANWTFSKVDSTGVTSSISGAVVTVTAITDSTDTGYVDVTGARTGYPSVTKRFSLSKSKAAPGAGAGPVQNWFANAEQGTGYPNSADAIVRMNTDGTVDIKQAVAGAGSYVYATNWFLPTTAGIGTSYWVKAVPRPGTSPLYAGTTGAYTRLTSAQSWRNFIGTGTVAAKDTTLDLYIAADNGSGAPGQVVAMASIRVEADES